MMNVSTERLNHTPWAVLSTGSFYRGRGPPDCKGFSGVQPFALASVALQQIGTGRVVAGIKDLQ